MDVERTGAPKLVLDGKNGTLSLTEPAQHGALDDYKVGEVASALEQLTADDVHPGAAPASGQIGHSVFTTTDGMHITADLFHEDKLLLARFDVTGEGKAAPDAAKLEDRVKGWTISSARGGETALLPALSDLEKAPGKSPWKIPLGETGRGDGVMSQHEHWRMQSDIARGFGVVAAR